MGFVTKLTLFAEKSTIWERAANTVILLRLIYNLTSLKLDVPTVAPASVKWEGKIAMGFGHALQIMGNALLNIDTVLESLES